MWRRLETAKNSYKLEGIASTIVYLHMKPVSSPEPYWALRDAQHMRHRQPLPEGLTVEEAQKYIEAQLLLMK